MNRKRLPFHSSVMTSRNDGPDPRKKRLSSGRHNHCICGAARTI